MTLKIEIIISRFNEDLKWTTCGIFNDYRYIVYNKGDNDDFEKFINKISFRGRENDKQNSFIYCDPPYLGTTDNYSNSFTEDDSIRLFNCLQNAGCKFAISEFDNDFVLGNPSHIF